MVGNFFLGNSISRCVMYVDGRDFPRLPGEKIIKNLSESKGMDV